VCENSGPLARLRQALWGEVLADTLVQQLNRMGARSTSLPDFYYESIWKLGVMIDQLQHAHQAVAVYLT
jgi:hypothetical protein